VLNITNREPRVRRGRLVVAVVCGIAAASLVDYVAALELTMQSAFAWLALFGLFEVVFAVTVTLISAWGRDDALARARHQQVPQSTYVDV
jgi:hypothetical protein